MKLAGANYWPRVVCGQREEPPAKHMGPGRRLSPTIAAGAPSASGPNGEAPNRWPGERASEGRPFFARQY